MIIGREPKVLTTYQFKVTDNPMEILCELSQKGYTLENGKSLISDDVLREIVVNRQLSPHKILCIYVWSDKAVSYNMKG